MLRRSRRVSAGCLKAYFKIRIALFGNAYAGNQFIFHYVRNVNFKYSSALVEQALEFNSVILKRL